MLDLLSLHRVKSSLVLVKRFLPPGNGNIFAVLITIAKEKNFK